MQIECPEIGGRVFNQPSILQKLDEEEELLIQEQDQKMINIELDLPKSNQKEEVDAGKGSDDLIQIEQSMSAEYSANQLCADQV